MPSRSFALCAALVALAIGWALDPSLAFAQRVGTAAAVKPSSTGTPPGGATRTLEIGNDIVSRERVRTTGGGSLQVMFLDKSTLTVGPNSDMVIDEFVFDPNAGAGTFAASLSKGALRFVGGQISHNAGATIATPVATIGLRGGAAFITHDAVCQPTNRGGQGRVAGSQGCTRVVCTGGTCTVNSRIESKSFQLRVSQAIEIGILGASQPFSVTSVTLGDAVRGGGGGVIAGLGNKSTTSFAGQNTVNQTVAEQTPEPPPPAPP